MKLSLIGMTIYRMRLCRWETSAAVGVSRLTHLKGHFTQFYPLPQVLDPTLPCLAARYCVKRTAFTNGSLFLFNAIGGTLGIRINGPGSLFSWHDQQVGVMSMACTAWVCNSKQTMVTWAAGPRSYGF